MNTIRHESSHAISHRANLAEQFGLLEQAQQDLRRSQLRLQATLECGGICTWVWDIPHNRVHFDDSAIKLFGFSPQEIADGSCSLFANYVHPEDREHFDAGLAAVLAGGGGDREMEYRVCRPDGTVVWVAARGHVEFDDAGRPVQMTGACVDISKQKHTDTALRASEQGYRTFVDHATDAFFLLHDGDGTILDVNDQACWSLGYFRDELLGATPALFGTRGASHKLAEIFAHIQQNGVYAFDSWHRRKDGSTFPVEVRIRSFQVDGRQMALAFARDMTDRVRAENALRESESFLRMSQRIGRIGSWEWNLTTNRVKWSEEMACIHGIHLDDFDGTLGMAASFFHPDDLPVFQQHLDDVMQGSEFAQWEYRIRRGDGAIRYLWPTAEVIRDTSGRPTDVVGVSIDISERIQSQEALRESEKRFRQLAESAFEGLMIHEQGVIRDSNQVFAELFGFKSPAELVDRHAMEVLPLTPESKQIVRRHLQSPHSHIFEVEAEMPDGTVRFFETQGRDIIHHGRSARVAAMRDITERKSRERSLRLFRTLIDRLDDAIEVIDAPTGRFLDVNDRGCLDLGYSREELLSLTVPDIDPLVSMAVYQQNLKKLREIGNFKLESVHRRRDGSSFPVEINVRLVRLDQEYMLAVVRDISERKRLEEQLRQSQKLEAIGRLAGGIAHDFNNLLTVVNGYSRHLLDKVRSDHSVHAGLTAIHEAGQRAASLVRQLLAFSRGQASQRVVLDLREVILQNENLLRQLLEEQIHLAILCEPDLAPVRVDRSQMEQVLMNLVVNARDAMPQGGCLTIRAGNLQLSERRIGIGCDLRPGRDVRISVADTGHGMTDDVKAKIFEPFFTTKDIGKGTGLGLPVVHGVVQQSGGQIEVSSEVGVGSCFSILLPAEPM